MFKQLMQNKRTLPLSCYSCMHPPRPRLLCEVCIVRIHFHGVPVMILSRFMLVLVT